MVMGLGVLSQGFQLIAEKSWAPWIGAFGVVVIGIGFLMWLNEPSGKVSGVPRDDSAGTRETEPRDDSEDRLRLRLVISRALEGAYNLGLGVEIKGRGSMHTHSRTAEAVRGEALKWAADTYAAIAPIDRTFARFFGHEPEEEVGSSEWQCRQFVESRVHRLYEIARQLDAGDRR